MSIRSSNSLRQPVVNILLAQKADRERAKQENIGISSGTFIASLLPKCCRAPNAGSGLHQEDHVEKLGMYLEFMQAGRTVPGDLTKQLHGILSLAQGLGESEPSTPPSSHAVEQAERFFEMDLLPKLVGQFAALDLEAATLTVNIFSVFLRLGLPQGLDGKVLRYLTEHKRLLDMLLEGCHSEQTALHCGVMIRSYIRHRETVSMIFEEQRIFSLVELARHPKFEVSSDAFCSMRQAFLEHKQEASVWLAANSQDFFWRYHQLLEATNYVGQRQALKLLSDILLDPQLTKVMIPYVSDERHLQIHMQLLRDESKIVQLEAFHVLKLFVANPQKPTKVHKILLKNKQALIRRIGNLQPSSVGEEVFIRDKEKVIDKLEKLRAASPMRSKSTHSTPKSKGKDLGFDFPDSVSNISTTASTAGTTASRRQPRIEQL